MATEHADLPDEIITCGEITAALIAEGMPEARPRLVVGAALRARRLEITDPSAWGIVAPISSSRAEAWEILRFLHALSEDDPTPILVRTHPTIPVDTLFRLFQWPPNVALSTGRTLVEDLARVTIIAYSSSTVALEGMLYGRLPVFVNIGDLPSGDPIMGEYAFKFLARDGATLAAEVDRMRKLDSGESARLHDEARAFAERYLRAPTPDGIRRMTELMLGA